MTKKKKKEDVISSIFDSFDFGSLSVDFSSTIDSGSTSIFTWPSTNNSWVYTTNTVDTTDATNTVNISNIPNITTDDWITTISDITFTSTLDIPELSDPFEELEKFRQEKEKEEALREEYPSLQEAYDDYQLIKKLVEDTEFDKTFEKRYEGFSKK